MLFTPSAALDMSCLLALHALAALFKFGYSPINVLVCKQYL